MKSYKRVLTIAGSDSGGGAGIQADIKAISACGCFATSAITAITAQNTLGVTDIHPVPVSTLKAQIKAVLEDIGTDAVKIGMLHNSETIQAVHDCLTEFKIRNIVLDPVMVATSGNKLLQDEAIESLKKILIPMARVITPNIPEAEILLGKKIEEQDKLPEYAKELSDLYGNISVLLKAGHLKDDQLTDIFYNAESGEYKELKSKRLYSRNTHGTGCTLSSALASYLAHGFSADEAASMAKLYIHEAISQGAQYKTGEGHGPVKHFHAFWTDLTDDLISTKPAVKPLGMFSEKLWESIRPVYHILIRHPFIKGLANGNLPGSCFEHYLAQDILYIQDDSKALEILADKAPNELEKSFLIKLANDGYDIERALHRDYLTHFNVQETNQKSIAIATYTSFLLKVVKQASYPLGAAALLPCFWVYHSVGKHIVKTAVEDNPYKKWIETYEGNEYEGYVARFVEIVEELGSTAPEAVQDLMIQSFERATNFELQFFEEAWQMQ